MARHRHRGSTNRSTAYSRDQGVHSAALPPVANDRCTSSRADFIPSWLHHVQASHDDSSRDNPRQTSPIDSKESSWHPNGLTAVRVQLNKAGKYQSSDLFIQDSPIQSSPPGQKCHHHHRQSDPNSDYGEDFNDGDRQYYSNQPASTSPGGSLARDPVFQKRPRRKTRQDRYNAIKSRAERVEKGNTKRHSTRVSKKGRLRSSREVMANFKSNAIANPNERITLEQTFTPGLFANGRSSAPLADLAFNDIPLPYENTEASEKEQSSNFKTKELKKRKSRRDEIEVFADALKRLVADYPPPESPSLPNSTGISNTSNSTFQPIGRANVTDAIDDAVVAGKTYTTWHNGSSSGGVQHGNGDGNERPSPRGSHTPHSGRKTGEAPKYEDKGVMVSPSIHQRAKGDNSYGNSYDLRTPNAFFEMPAAEVNQERQLPQSKSSKADTINVENRIYEYPPNLPQVSEGFDFKTTEIEDTNRPRGLSPASFFNRTSAGYPSHTLHPHPNMGLASFDCPDPSKIIGTQPRVTYSVDWPAQSAVPEQTAYQPRQEAFQDLNIFSRKTSQVIDDIPGESLKEYIERMEREILVDSEPSARCMDEALLSTEAIYQSQAVEKPHTYVFGDGRHTDEFHRGIEFQDRLPRRDLTHRPEQEDLGWPSRQDQWPSYPEESPDGSEIAFFWRPNHMMWC
ncbi:hypothetical protein ACHAQJ_002864 [Trichoderma viride]